MADAVRIEGLSALRKDLRAMEKSDESREVTQALKQGAGVVAVKASAFAPKGTRPIPATRKPRARLAATVRPSANGKTAFVRTRAVYAFKAEKRTAFMARALESEQDRIVEKVGDALDAVAARHGW